MRHASPATTLKHYQKSIPEAQRSAVEKLDPEFRERPEQSETNEAGQRTMISMRLLKELPTCPANLPDWTRPGQIAGSKVAG